MNNALEEGHAYFISDFVLEYNGDYAAIKNYASNKSNLVSIDYASKSLKVDIVDAGFFVGQIQRSLNVVIVGGKYKPTVIGLIEVY